jgi:pantoate--beta-alanine ligase
MGQVVLRLLDIVQPDALFMGQKDFQQFAIIRHLIQRLNLSVELVMCPTIRESNGLAMSSRNLRLDPKARVDATIIYQTLVFCSEHFKLMSLAELQEDCLRKLDIPGFRPEYFEIVDGVTLLPATEKTSFVVACCAVWAGDVRLIDNMILSEPAIT